MITAAWSAEEMWINLKTGLTPVPVEHVKAPAIAESPVNIACRVVESHPLGSHTMFVAEVLGVTVDDAYLDETGKFDINGTGLIMYSHGEYFALGKKLGKFGYSVQKKKNDTRLIAAACPSVQHIHLHFSFSSYCRWLLPVLL